MAKADDVATIDFYSNPELFAGDHMKLVHTEDGRSVISFEPTTTGRKCGSCTLCCKLLPIPRPPLNKPANVRCQYQRQHVGCTIYAKRPMSCRSWACRWLIDEETAGMKRPDRSHVVIDMTDDYIETVDRETGERRKHGVIQIWCDPDHREAYRAPEVRAYMLQQALKYGAPTLVRFSPRDGVAVFPPPITHDGQWHERNDGLMRSNTPLQHQVDIDQIAWEEKRGER